MENRIKNIMAAIFKIDVASIDENSSPDSIEQWDSLRHMNLVVALEEEFNIKFIEDEIVDMLNYKLICLTIKEKISK